MAEHSEDGFYVLMHLDHGALHIYGFNIKPVKYWNSTM